MRHRVLVIEGEGVPENACIYASLAKDESVNCRRGGWEGVVPQRFGEAEDLIAAVAIPRTPAVTRVFEWLRSNALALPIFAVLPNDADDELVRQAIDAVDDFIFPPIRGVELGHRLRPLLE